jgi:2-dehydro-3-deoxygluconokinase
MRKKVITIGEIMMRLSTPGHERFLQANAFEAVYGGAEANVAVSLAQWDVESYHVTAFPDHDLGNAATRYLKQVGVNTDFIYKAPGRLGIYFLENGAMHRSTKIIYDRFDSSFSNFDGATAINWNNVFEGKDWFHWTGITPALSQKAAEMTLAALKAAAAKGLTISGDINYRRNLWQYGKTPLEIMPELIQYTHVMVAGLADFENCLNITSKDYKDACETAYKNFPQLKYITSTERESISSSENGLKAVLWTPKSYYTSKKYEMRNIVDRVGGGDAYMAGLIYGLLHMSDPEALEFAIAASVLKHSIPGDANLVSLDEVYTLIKGENIGRLLR